MRLREQTQAQMRFTRFFQRDAHFADKVGLALRGLRFLDICRNTGSRSENLAHHHAADAWPFIHFSAKLDDADGQIKSPLNNILRLFLPEPSA